jgi:hypothetical protein
MNQLIINQSMNQSNNESINQSINQSIDKFSHAAKHSLLISSGYEDLEY